jgi:hypothetical protein
MTIASRDGNRRSDRDRKIHKPGAGQWHFFLRIVKKFQTFAKFGTSANRRQPHVLLRERNNAKK